MATERNGQKFELYDQQIKGISFLCHHENGLLAYEVGAGKHIVESLPSFIRCSTASVNVR
ncbi:MAG: hypothetical protein MR911_04165 [Spirochaetia bacterium]|nr:hypothetical protein [Spirochaetia bacterium]MCI6365676.1 hypothetical protein [Spirochaetia bacterium]